MCLIDFLTSALLFSCCFLLFLHIFFFFYEKLPNGVGEKSFIIKTFAENLSLMNTELKSKLSEKELEIIKLLEKGLSNKSISLQCNISENTVKFHLKNIFKKLDVHNRVEAIYKLNILLIN